MQGGVIGFTEAIKEQREGFSFGEPWRWSKDRSITCIVPILRDSAEKPEYHTLASAKNVEIKDTGSISRVSVFNNGKKPLFIRMGELFKGATQERASIKSVVIMPGQHREVEVVCVHATKGIVRGSAFKSVGYTPDRDYLYCQALYSSQGKGVGQAESWSEDRSYRSRAEDSVKCSLGEKQVESLGYFASVGQDDLTTAREVVTEALKDVIKEVPLFENQIGMALIDPDGVHSIECFDLHRSWKEVKEAIVGKESLAISRTEDGKEVFEIKFKPENTTEKIKEVLGKLYDEREVFKEGGAVTFAISCGDYVGEATLLNDKVIHLLITRKQ